MVLVAVFVGVLLVVATLSWMFTATVGVVVVMVVMVCTGAGDQLFDNRLEKKKGREIPVHH